MFQYKQVIVLRADLNMTPGKAAAQACHGSLSASEKTKRENISLWRKWIKEGQRKVILKASSEAELRTLDRIARKSKISTALISDMGLTELPLGTVTSLGMGPASSKIIDKITGSLPLY